MSASQAGSTPRLGFALLAALLVLALIEGSARVFMAGLEATGFDEASWRNAWVRDRAGRREIFYSFDRFDPSKGWISKSNLRDHPAFAGIALSTNSAGLRGAREIDDFEPEQRRLLVLGDSFTFGDEVADDQVWPSRLEQALPNTRVVNFGVHGYGHDQMLILLRELGAKARPEIVVLGFVYPDIHRNLLGFRDFAKPRFEFRDGQLELLNMPLPTPEEVSRSALFRPAVLDVASVARGLLDARSGALDERARELTRHLLDALLAEIGRLGAQPVFVYLPVEGEIEDTSPAPTSRERFLLDFCVERDVACASLRLGFARAHAAGAELATVGHWGPRGHRIAADGIAAFVSTLPAARSGASKRIGRGPE